MRFEALWKWAPYRTDALCHGAIFMPAAVDTGVSPQNTSYPDWHQAGSHRETMGGPPHAECTRRNTAEQLLISSWRAKPSHTNCHLLTKRSSKFTSLPTQMLNYFFPTKRKQGFSNVVTGHEQILIEKYLHKNMFN